MNEKNTKFRQIFHNLKFLFAGFSGLLLLFFSLTIFTETCGGPYPQRVRGPLAHKPFYELGELPEWEDVIHEKYPDSEGELENPLELMLEDESVPPLEFGTPQATPTPQTTPTPEPAVIPSSATSNEV